MLALGRVVVAAGLVALGPQYTFAACTDAAAVVTTRAAAEAACAQMWMACETASTHGRYVSCIADQVKAAVKAGTLPKDCKGTVVRCAARSTCRRPGFVTCCRTDRHGKRSCAIKRTAARCVAPKGGSACVSVLESCCDACAGDQCTTSTLACGTFVTMWGSRGAGAGQFQQPGWVATDGAGHVYVTDRGNNRVQKFDEVGNFITAWGTPGSGDGQFSGPAGIAVDRERSWVYVADQLNDDVQKFDSDGNFLLRWGTTGTGDGQFIRPSGVAIDLNFPAYVYVTDYTNSRVETFSNGNGVFGSKWGSFGTGDGQFGNEVAGIAVVGGGARASPFPVAYVTDQANSRVEVFTETGLFFLKWGSPGQGAGQLNGPTGIAVVNPAAVFVADSGNDRIVVFDEGGNFLTMWGNAGAGPGQFAAPGGLAVTPPSASTSWITYVYVADQNNNRIQKFAVGPCP